MCGWKEKGVDEKNMLPVFVSFGGNKVVKWIFYKTENWVISTSGYGGSIMVKLLCVLTPSAFSRVCFTQTGSWTNTWPSEYTEKRTGFGNRGPWVKSQLSFSPATRPWTRHLAQWGFRSPKLDDRSPQKGQKNLKINCACNHH